MKRSYSFEAVQAAFAPVHKQPGEQRFIANYPYAFPTHTPWFEAEFDAVYQGVSDHTTVTADRCFVLHQMARQSARLPGLFAECGVYRGGTALLLARQLVGPRLHIFDTFTGMPAAADSDPGIHSKGDFGDTSLAAVQALLSDHEVTSHVGELPGTLAVLAAQRFAMVHIDVDLYETTMACCAFFYSRMSVGGILIIDDYGFEPHRDTAGRAVDEFFADKPEVPLYLRSGQCLIMRLPDLPT